MEFSHAMGIKFKTGNVVCVLAQKFLIRPADWVNLYTDQFKLYIDQVQL